MSVWHLAGLAYGLALLSVVALFFFDGQEVRPFTEGLHVEIRDKLESSSSLVFRGEGLHEGMSALNVPKSQGSMAPLWKILPGTSVKVLDASDNLILAGCYQNMLVSIDTSVPEAPLLLDSLTLSHTIKSIKIIGKRAVVGLLDDGGVAVIDLNVPAALKLLQVYPFQGSVLDMAVAGDYVYYVNDEVGLGRINVASENAVPESLVKIAKPWRLAFARGRLVVAGLDGSLHLFDVSDHATLTRAGTMFLPGFDRGGIRGVALTAGTLSVALADKRIRSFSLSGWPSLEQSADLDLYGIPYRIRAVPGSESFVVSIIAGGVALIDAERPGQASLAGYLRLPRTMLSMDIEGKILFCSGHAGSRGLLAYDLASLRQADAKPLTSLESHFHSLLSWNGRLFGLRRDEALVDFGVQGTAPHSVDGPVLMASGEDGVGVFTSSSSGDILRLGSIVDKQWALNTVYAEGNLYVLHRGGLRIFSGASLTEMAPVGELSLSGRPAQIKILKPGYLLVTSKDEGLKVIDVSDVSQPSLIANVEIPHHLQSSNVGYDVLIYGDMAYMSQGSGGVYVVDLTDPENPDLLQVLNTPGAAMHMVMHDDLLFVADGDKGVFMIDVSSPDRALPVGVIPTPLRAVEIAAASDGILVSSYPADVTLKLPYPQKLEVLQRDSPNELQVRVPADVLTGYAYLYDERSRRRVSMEEVDN